MQRKHHAISSAPAGLPVYRQVYRRIRSEILSGRLAAGARLPSQAQPICRTSRNRLNNIKAQFLRIAAMRCSEN
jgi:DNA-binding GntR family transcriptional regulator